MASDKKSRPVVLVTVAGPDKPGITAELTGILAKSNSTILDIGQAVIQGLLSLSILFELHPDEEDDKTTIKDLLFKATELGLKLEFQVLDRQDLKKREKLRSDHYALTLLGENLSGSAVHRVAATLGRFAMNIDTIQRLSENEFSCVEMQISSTGPLDRHTLKKDLLKIAMEQRVDIALQSEGLFRRSKRLVVFDMDSTLIQNEVIDEIAREKGVYEEVAKITHEAMKGQMDFDESLRLRCRKLEGVTVEELDRVFNRIQITPGAQELIQVLKKLGYKVALISGGFSVIADRLKAKLDIDYAYANKLEIHDGKLTGRVIPPIVNAQRKADLLELIAQQERASLDQVIAIGDGANDLLMLEKAGLGIAFNAKPVVSEKADLAINQKNLKAVLYLLGISGREMSEIMMNGH